MMKILLFFGYLCLISFLGLVVSYGKPNYVFIAEISSYEIRVPEYSVFGLVWILSIPFLLAAILAKITERMLHRKRA